MALSSDTLKSIILPQKLPASYWSDINLKKATLYDLVSTITGSSSAADISVVPTGNISSTNVQDALEELQTDINGLGGSGDMTKLVYDSDDDGIVDAAESVPWAGITGLPSTFPPDSHTHTYADITSGIIPHNTVAQLAVGADLMAISTLIDGSSKLSFLYTRKPQSASGEFYNCPIIL